MSFFTCSAYKQRSLLLVNVLSEKAFGFLESYFVRPSTKKCTNISTKFNVNLIVNLSS